MEVVRQKGRTILTEYESKQVFAAYGIPTVATLLAADADEAVAQAEKLGLSGRPQTQLRDHHPQDRCQGVQLNLRTAAAVRQAYETIQTTVSERVGAEHFQGVTVQPMVKLDGYELIVGSSQDAQFGPVLLFGTGGTLVEVFRIARWACRPSTPPWRAA